MKQRWERAVKIGIYGGTYNPPHLGHLAAARTAIDALKLDKLLLMPAAVPPHKALPENTPAQEHRLAMVEKLADAMDLHGFEWLLRAVVSVPDGPHQTAAAQWHGDSC